MGGCCHFFITLQFNHIYYVWGEVSSLYYFSELQSFELAMQDFHPSLYCTKTWYYLYISDPFWSSTKNVDCFI